MPRPLFAFDRQGLLTIIVQAPTDDFEAVSHDFEDFDVDGDEFRVFDIDGQVLAMSSPSEAVCRRHDLDGTNMYVHIVVGTGEYDLPGLMECATHYATMLRRRLPADEPLIALANYDDRFGTSALPRGSILPWRRRRPEPPIMDLEPAHGGPYSRWT